jgi:fibronectin-binding autotransporter adhesin
MKRTSTTWFATLLCCSFPLSALLAASPSVWNGGGADDLWSNPANWGGNAPVPGDTYDLQFAGSTRLTPTNDLPAGSNFRNLTFNAGAGAFKLRGNPFALNGNLVNNSSVLQTVTNHLFTVSGKTATISGDLLLAGRLTNYSILNINSGNITSLANFITAPLDGQSGAVNIKGGYFKSLSAWSFYNFMVGALGYGSLNVSGGTVDTHGFMLGSGSASSGIGIGLVAGGTVIVDDNVTVPYYGGTAVLTVGANGALVRVPGTTKSLNVMQNSAGRGELNLLGGIVDNAGGTIGLGTSGTSQAGFGIVNLNAGTLTTAKFNPVNGNTYLNFNGGTLKAFANNAAFVPAAFDGVYVRGPFGSFAGGAVIDTVGFTNTVVANLLAPTGQGVSDLAVANGGSGYLGAPYVSVVDGSGTGLGATAIANMVDDGTGNGTLKVESVKVTNPGTDYTPGSVSYSFSGGGTATPATPGAVTLANNTSGGLTKLGQGTLVLSGSASAYSGATTVSEGSLLVNGALGNSAVSVKSGAALGGTGTVTGTVAVEAGGSISPGDPAGATAVGTLSLGSGLSLANQSVLKFEFIDAYNVDKLVVNGNLGVAGTVTLQLPGSSAVANGDYTLMEVSGTLGGSPASFAVANPDPTKSYQLIYQSGTPNQVILRIGTAAVLLTWNGGTGVWNVNGAVNWLNQGTTPSVFHNNDPVVFNDTGSSVPNVNITETVAPSHIDVNASSDYSFGGAGHIDGPAALVKSGSGALTLANANTFTGGIILNSGTLNVNHPSALGTGGLTINGGAIGTTASSPLTLQAGPQTWAASFEVNPRSSLDLGASLISLAAASTVTVNSNTLTAANITGVGSLTKAGQGTLVLGSFTNSSALTVTAGSLGIKGPVEAGTGSWVVESTTDKPVLAVDSGAMINKNGHFTVGFTSGTVGAVNVKGGTFISTDPWTFYNFDIGGYGYGAVNLTGGRIESRGFILNGRDGAGGIGMVSISGGTWEVGPSTDAANVMLAYYGGTGVLTVSGTGTFKRTLGTSTLTLCRGSAGRGELNLLGGMLDNGAAPVALGGSGGINATAVVNLNGGTLITSALNYSYPQNPILNFLNFNGATLRPFTNNAAFITNTIANVIVNGPFGAFAGGAVIDTAGFDAGVLAGLSAPTGQGVSALAVVDGGSGYIGEPYVSIVDASGLGKGATAVAVMADDGTGNGTLRVASVKVTNPGVNYTGGAVAYTFAGGAPTVPATPGAVFLAANTSGGLTKLGDGTLTLAGTNTYTGATLVNAGTLAVDGSLAAASAVTVAAGRLAGNGIIDGPVTVQAGAALAPGSSIGTLTINNTLFLAANSTTFIELDKAAATNDLLNATAVNYGGILMVTNQGGALAAGDSFQLFRAGSHTGSFSQMVISGATGSFDAATGILSITGSMADYPTNISFAFASGRLSLSWPETHRGWYAQSNALDVANSAGWFDIPGSQNQTAISITVNPATPKVFYRLRKP